MPRPRRSVGRGAKGERPGPSFAEDAVQHQGMEVDKRPGFRNAQANRAGLHPYASNVALLPKSAVRATRAVDAIITTVNPIGNAPGDTTRGREMVLIQRTRRGEEE